MARARTPDTNSRWPDVLAGRLQANPATRHLSVLNAGIAGNRVLGEANARPASTSWRDSIATF